ncbi:30S ribosomal protein S10 [Candidatus Roizmanbacteria bacterium RIFCSPHIGHO2_02_FULL_40_13b]|uniref:Small ribosomal subunit protein uS10 n=1 Tax=Candidatus Roizmanbacteria bacterium RIFCSPHIGHO2_01_FULL_39_24 TaxID=1802032 RepID=A0A1F7GL47_9BACT|nr:MAG: 30S ribosomal protein S10 [Candidatus Roizmanbacteria bacterium RIFCSPHIGHO2_01_FULL_39_24]OGK27803.1 MAG: 30S ribosomal protein S10 [Candidatus Roizmanbacteria bacterium RIFCSPHIGHO2_02_FULL_40_13b]OGK49944.1 MAG: 30S ribosomal protein S10 [Candidatus Roizmanbacteria bacterium RIFCSPLOWO2_01_FULL_40_32]
MPKGKIRIRLKSYDHRLIDETCQKLIDTATKTGASFVGPVPLPTKKEVYVVTRATFVDKDSREHFGLKIHKRLLDIVNPTNQTIDSLMHLDLPAGVNVEVKMG